MRSERNTCAHEVMRSERNTRAHEVKLESHILNLRTARRILVAGRTIIMMMIIYIDSAAVDLTSVGLA